MIQVNSVKTTIDNLIGAIEVSRNEIIDFKQSALNARNNAENRKNLASQTNKSLSELQGYLNEAKQFA